MKKKKKQNKNNKGLITKKSVLVRYWDRNDLEFDRYIFGSFAKMSAVIRNLAVLTLLYS